MLMERWVVYHGVPTVIHSDQGREFEGRVSQRLAELLGATKTHTVPIGLNLMGLSKGSTERC